MASSDIRMAILPRLHDALLWRTWLDQIRAAPDMLLSCSMIEWVRDLAYASASAGQDVLVVDLRRTADLLEACAQVGVSEVLGNRYNESVGGDPMLAAMLRAAEPGQARGASLEEMRASIALLSAALAHKAMNHAPVGLRRLTEFNAANVRIRALQWERSQELAQEAETLISVGLSGCLRTSRLWPSLVQCRVSELTHVS